jgi:hypothetical protein
MEPDITSMLLAPRMRAPGDKRSALPFITSSGGLVMTMAPRTVLGGKGRVENWAQALVDMPAMPMAVASSKALRRERVCGMQRFMVCIQRLK